MSKLQQYGLAGLVLFFILGVTIWDARRTHDARLEFEKKRKPWIEFQKQYASIEWTRSEVKARENLPGAIAALESFSHRWTQTNAQTEWVPVRLAQLRQIQQAIAPVDSGGVAEIGSAAPAEAPLTAAFAQFQRQLGEQKKRFFSLQSPTITAELTAQGGSVEYLALNDLKEPSFKPVTQRDKPMKELEPFRPLGPWQDVNVKSFALTSNTERGLEGVDWLHEDLPAVKGHRFKRVLQDGSIVVTKDYVPSPSSDDFHFTLTVTVENQGKDRHTFGYGLIGAAGMTEPTSAYPQPIEAVIATADVNSSVRVERRAGPQTVESWKKEKRSLSAIANPQVGSRIAFFGTTVKSFACVLVPLTPNAADSVRDIPLLELAGRQATLVEQKAAEAHESSPANQIAVQAAVKDVLLDPGQKVSYSYLVYVGPRWRQHLLDHPIYSNAGLADLVDYSMWFWPVSTISSVLAQLLTKLLLGFHWITRSWGVSIVLLTILVRALLHPLMLKQQRNSFKMQALGPEIAKLKEKFTGKDGEMSPENQRRFQAEQWELWKKHGINPLGCMGPMFLQMPIFLGLWSSLNYAFELRQASFLWIRDLSEPDVIARLPFNLPFLGLNALCVLPILMFIVYVLQMRMMPKPTDPQAAEQQKVMNWMMPLFGYMFYRVPSGLLLYYITSALLGMAETRWIKKRLGMTTPATAPAPAKA